MTSADDFMPYPNFDPTLLPECHRLCQDRTRDLLRNYGSAIVHNTFTQHWEMAPYLKMHSKVTVIDLFDGGLTNKELAERNTHGVPEAAIKRMRDRWEK